MVIATVGLVLAIGGLAILSGCGPGDPPDPKVGGPAQGSLAVTLVNEGVAAGVQTVTLEIMGVDVRQTDGPWLAVPLGSPAKTVALMTDVIPLLVEDSPLEPGVYPEARLRLGGHHAFTGQDGVRHALAVPPELHCGHADLRIARGALAHYAFLVSAAGAIRETPPGSGAFTLAGHELLCRNVADTAFILGGLHLEGTHSQVTGAILTAQARIPGTELYQVLRTATSRADGSYTLDLLPRGPDYRVLAQSGPGRPPIAPVVSEPLPMGPADPPSRMVDLLTRPLGHRQGGKVTIRNFPRPAPDSGLSELTVRNAPGPDRFPLPFNLILAQHRVTGPGPFDLGFLPAGQYLLAYDHRPWDAMATGTGQAASAAGEIQRRPLRITAGAAVEID